MKIFHSKAHFNKSVALNWKKDYHGAIECCNRVLDLDPNFSKAYNNREYAQKMLQEL